MGTRVTPPAGEPPAERTPEDDVLDELGMVLPYGPSLEEVLAEYDADKARRGTVG